MPKMVGIKVIRFEAGFSMLEKLDELCEKRAKEEMRREEAAKLENKTFNYEFFTQIFRQKYRNL